MREVSEIEARLKRHRDDNRYIDNQIERLETLILRMKGVSSPSLSGMPHNPSSDVDKIGQMLERKEKLEADIRELIADRDRERDELRSIIGCIHKPDQRSRIGSLTASSARSQNCSSKWTRCRSPTPAFR